MIRMTALVLVIALAASTTRAQSDYDNDPTDHVLSAYRFAGSLEAQFVRDGKMSSFWDEWVTPNSDGLRVRDYVDLTTVANAFVLGDGAFTGPDDARMLVQAGYAEKGLYLLLEVHDDDWSSGLSETENGISFLLDKLSSQEIRDANPYQAYVQPSWLWSLTYTSIHFSASVRGSSLPGTIDIDRFDDSVMYWGIEPVQGLATSYNGLNLDLDASIPGVRLMEWFIPWTWVGAGGGVGSMPAEGAMVAAQFGYNDIDARESAMAGRTALRWKEKDAFNGCRDQTPPHDFCDSWGDICFGLHPMSIECPPLSVTSPNGGEHWQVGEYNPITWQTDGIASRVALQYTNNGGVTWITIDSLAANTGSYVWQVPSDSSANCRVRVSHSGRCWDVSDRYFSLGSSAAGTTINREVPKRTFISHVRCDTRSGRVLMAAGLACAGQLSVLVYDAGGRLVRQIDKGQSPAGVYELSWDRRGSGGTCVRAGTYLVQIRAGERVSNQFVVLAR